MANFAFTNGQAGVINLENVDIITRERNTKNAKYEIVFYRSTRKTRAELPEIIAAWAFTTELERDQIFNDLIGKNGEEYVRKEFMF